MDPLNAANWTEPDPAVLDRLTHNAVFAADTAVISCAGAAGHEKTKAAVRAALRMLLANGMITAAPEENLPEWIRIDAP